MVRRKYRRRSMPEEDPMTGTSNIVDAMLVLSVGLLIFVVLSWNMQDVVFSDMTQEQRQDTMQSMKQVSQINQGRELNDTPNPSEGSGEGYTEMGKVYKDPKTGKLIMIEE